MIQWIFFCAFSSVFAFGRTAPWELPECGTGQGHNHICQNAEVLTFGAFDVPAVEDVKAAFMTKPVNFHGCLCVWLQLALGHMERQWIVAIQRFFPPSGAGKGNPVFFDWHDDRCRWFQIDAPYDT